MRFFRWFGHKLYRLLFRWRIDDEPKHTVEEQLSQIQLEREQDTVEREHDSWRRRRAIMDAEASLRRARGR